MKYKDWEVVDKIPTGWVIDKTCGSPMACSVFITNNKSPLKGQKRKILKQNKMKTNDYEKNNTCKYCYRLFIDSATAKKCNYVCDMCKSRINSVNSQDNDLFKNNKNK